MKKLILGVITHLFFLFALAAHADEPNNAERITSFISDVAINQDASIDVIEQITVFANQARIRHGIVRWLPVTSSFYQPYSIKKISIDHHIAP